MSRAYASARDAGDKPREEEVRGAELDFGFPSEEPMDDIEVMKIAINQHAQTIRELQGASVAYFGLLGALAKTAGLTEAICLPLLDSATLYSTLPDQTREQALRVLRALLSDA